MKYTCKDCTHNFNPASQFETACPACGSENTAPIRGNNGGFMDWIKDFFSKPKNRYILIGLLIFIILMLKLCRKPPGEDTYYYFKCIPKSDHVQFVIEAKVKDKNGNQKDEIRKLKPKDAPGLDIYIVIDGKPVKIDGTGGLKLVDGDKFYGFCSIDGPLKFMIDPKRLLGDRIEGSRLLTWNQTMVSQNNCCPRPVPLVAGGVKAEQRGTNIIITTNLDTIPNHAPIYYSIEGKEGPYVEGKNTWEACSLTQIDEIWVTTGTDDTTAASGAFPIIVNKSNCPISAAEAQALKSSIQNAGNTFGNDMTDMGLLNKFGNSFRIMVDSDGNGSADKSITQDPNQSNIKFIIDGNTLSYMAFQSYVFGLSPPVKKYVCIVNMINGKVISVSFQ